MKYEFSAGGVVFKRENNEILVLVVQHGGYSHHWGFPKGHIGDKIKGEKKEDAAVREVREETGMEAEIEHPLKPITFWYTVDREKRKKTVYFFVMKVLGGSFEKKDHEMRKVEWFPLAAVKQRLTHVNEKKLFDEAIPIIQALAKSSVQSA